MHLKNLTLALAATIMYSVSASPLAQADTLVLWNGNENVVTTLDRTSSASQHTNVTTAPGLVRRDNIDCSGQGLCDDLGGVTGDCAKAMRNIVSTNIYQTGSK